MSDSIELEPEQHELIHDLVVTTNTQLDNIAEHHRKAYGPALLALLTYLIEKTYMSAVKIEDANAVIQCAQDVGLQNWIDQAETKKDGPRIVTLDDDPAGGV